MIEIKAVKNGAIVKINLSRLDISNKDLILGELQKLTRFNKLLLDLSELNFIDSTGIGVITGLYKKIKSNNGKLGLINMNNRVATVLKITGLSEFIKSYNSENAFFEEEK